MPTPAAAAPGRVIPAEAISRLLRNLEAFVRAVHEALASPDADPAQHPRWARAAALLRQHLAAAQQAARTAGEGDQAPLIDQAAELRLLARRMDGYRLDFAGAALAERLETGRRLTVLVAWQIYATGTGQQATGL